MAEVLSISSFDFVYTINTLTSLRQLPQELQEAVCDLFSSFLIPGKISQGVRRIRLRYARYIGLARTQLQQTGSASAINLIHLFSWLTGERPRTTRVSPFITMVVQS